MADLSITSISLEAGSFAKSDKNMGEVAALGDVCYLSTADGELYKADANDSSKRSAIALLLTPGTDGGVAVYARAGAKVNVGSGLTKNTIYVVSANAAGKIAPLADLASGDFTHIVGIAESTSILQLMLTETDIEV